jgi:hypothetical protein
MECERVEQDVNSMENGGGEINNNDVNECSTNNRMQVLQMIAKGDVKGIVIFVLYVIIMYVIIVKMKQSILLEAVYDPHVLNIVDGNNTDNILE